MARVSVQVIGDRLASQRIRRTGTQAHAQGTTMAIAARQTARGITGVPVATGRLRASIDVLDSDPYGFLVGSRGVRYAPFVFRGTSKMAARPPKVPASVGPATAAAVGRSVTH